MAANEGNDWMTESVAILKGSGSILKGEYDGYGNIDDRTIVDDEPACWHRACWEKAGKPLEWNGESPFAPDQGWFFDDGVHNIPKP